MKECHFNTMFEMTFTENFEFGAGPSGPTSRPVPSNLPCISRRYEYCNSIAYEVCYAC